MNNNTSILSPIEDAEIAMRKRGYFIKMRVGQITALILAVILLAFSFPAFGITDAGAFFVSLGYLALAALSFKWPFACLLAYSIVSVIFFLAFIGFIVFLWDVVLEEGTSTIFIIFNTFYLLLEILIVRGTIAAGKYSNFSK